MSKPKYGRRYAPGEHLPNWAGPPRSLYFAIGMGLVHWAKRPAPGSKLIENGEIYKWREIRQARYDVPHEVRYDPFPPPACSLRQFREPVAGMFARTLAAAAAALAFWRACSGRRYPRDILL